MKQYLNRQECCDWLFLCAMFDQIDRIVEEWGDNLDKDERRKLKTASTMLLHTATHIVDRVSLEDKIKLKRSADNWEMKMLPKHTSTQYRKRVESEMKEEGVWCSTELLCLMAEKSLLQCCKPCKEPEEERGNCPLRHAFVGLDIPVFDANPCKSVCPYCVTE